MQSAKFLFDDDKVCQEKQCENMRFYVQSKSIIDVNLQAYRHYLNVATEIDLLQPTPPNKKKYSYLKLTVALEYHTNRKPKLCAWVVDYF